MKKLKHVLISILVPFGIMGLIAVIAYLLCGAGLVANDCFEQYVPFLSAYYDIIKEGKSIFYSLTGSMGYDFWAVFSYYLVSPLNLVMLFFDKADIVYVVNALIVIKVALSGGTFAVFIKNRFPKAKCSRVVMFSTVYALSGFTVGYMWNIMWLDGILLFPLVIMGMDILMRHEKHKWYWYTLFLSLLIINSYFIGYMSCIFIFLYFFTYNFKSFGDFIKKLLTIGVSSLLAIGISAIILLPSFGGLQGTYISGETLPALEFYGSYVDSFKSVMIAVIPTGITFSSQYANLFMTTLVMLLAYTYFTTGSIALNKKIRMGLLLAILLFSLNFKPLNFVWHGMHEQAGIPNRFSFMIIFLMITMAFEVCRKKRSQVKRSSVFAAAGILAVCYGAMAYFDNSLIIPAGITVLFLAVYVITMGFASGKLKFRMIQVFVYLEVVIVLLTGIFTVSSRPIGNYGSYIDDFDTINSLKENGYYREKLDEVYNDKEQYLMYDMDIGLENLSVDTIKEYCDYMKNIGHQSVVNEETIYGINAMSLFNTFNNYELSLFYCSIGATGGTNNVMYYGENAFMDMLLGVRYYYTRYYDSNSSSYEYVETVGDVDIYRNKYALSVGYAIPENMADNDIVASSNPFMSMNCISNFIVGKNVFTSRNVQLEEDKADIDGTLLYSIDVTEEQELLIYPMASELQRIDIYINGDKVYTGNRSMAVVDIGTVSAEDKVEVLITLTDKEPNQEYGNVVVYAAAVSEEVIAETYDLLSERQFAVTEYSDDGIKGTIELDKASDVLFTIPYVKGESIIARVLPENLRNKYEKILPAGGWEITVDGKTVEASKWNDLFIMLKLDEGVHSIEMEYISPGFSEGAAISVLSAAVYLIALAITLGVTHRRKRKSDSVADEKAVSAGNMPENEAQLILEKEKFEREAEALQEALEKQTLQDRELSNTENEIPEAVLIEENEELEPEAVPIEKNEEPEPEAVPIEDNEEPEGEAVPIEDNEEPEPEAVPIEENEELEAEAVLIEDNEELEAEAVPIEENEKPEGEAVPIENNEEPEPEIIPVKDNEKQELTDNKAHKKPNGRKRKAVKKKNKPIAVFNLTSAIINSNDENEEENVKKS